MIYNGLETICTNKFCDKTIDAMQSNWYNQYVKVIISGYIAMNIYVKY